MSFRGLDVEVLAADERRIRPRLRRAAGREAEKVAEHR